MFKHIYYIPIFLLSFLALNAFSQDPPDLRCVSVNTDGSITLEWIQPPNGTGFVEYEIYFATSLAGPYSLAGTVPDYNTESFTHTGVSGLTTSYFYYIISDYLSGNSSPSTTLRSILLLLYSPNPETAQLSWNPPATPLLPGMDNTYNIYMEYPSGTWSLVGTTTDTEFETSFQFCNANLDIVNFQVTINDPVGNCSCMSSIMGELLYNYVGPAIPVMDSVSITPGGQVIIGWQPNPSPDAIGYVIYLVTGTNDSIDYVDGINTTTYIDPIADPCAASYSYAISAIDSCGNESPGTYDIPQNTLLINELVYDPCLLNTRITWNPYINFDPPLERYEVHVSEEGGPFELIASIGTGGTSFLHEDLKPNTTYEYFVRAFSQGNQRSSTSCRKTITTYDSPRPDFMYQRYVTVLPNEDVEIMFYTDTSAFINQYTISRSEDASGPYEEIGFILPGEEENIMYTDESANVQRQSYYYSISVTDTCGIVTAIDNISRTILLSVTANEDRTNDLSWNSYELWDGSVDRYEVFRIINGVQESAPLGILPPTTLSYTDDVSGLSGSNSVIEYLVIAYESNGNIYGFQDESRSNIARALQESTVYVPNAFAPYGVNRTFKPVSSFVSPDAYQFIIFDRWGKQVFQTSNPDEAWDGKIKGDIAPEAMYIWLLRYRDTSNKLIDMTGTVMLLY